MLIIALVLALIGLIALVFAVVTSNELVAWVCIAASVLGVVLLIIDALRERQRRDAGAEADADEELEDAEDADAAVDYPEEVHDEEERPAAESGEPGAESEDEQVDDRAK
ncbi:hypothetical protein BST11_23035 [Mycobacterium alsense]|uniref:Transmembrane protein n=1 Tax=Mycobacterium alsense TaxID=324058 RepID=A0AA42C039_9MYCO|nr:hypothetical protein [Mycobacterium alsense]MCV7381116.1 hypothetical protein [Mycobacterium alsense]OQZ88378.1 hypothetical protein BST11_23035 [Mycobacterium alsense]